MGGYRLHWARGSVRGGQPYHRLFFLLVCAQGTHQLKQLVRVFGCCLATRQQFSTCTEQEMTVEAKIGPPPTWFYVDNR